MRLTLLAAVASAALISSGALAQEKSRPQEPAGAAISGEKAGAQAQKSEAQAPRAAQANERQGEGANRQATPRAAQSEERGAAPSGANPGRTTQNGVQEKGINQRGQNGAERAERSDQSSPARTGAAEERQNPNARTGAAEQHNPNRMGAGAQGPTRTGAAQERGAGNQSAEGRPAACRRQCAGLVRTRFSRHRIADAKRPP